MIYGTVLHGPVEMNTVKEKFSCVAQGAEELARWEEKKKWQKTVERLKGKLEEKEKEVESQQRALVTLKELLSK